MSACFSSRQCTEGPPQCSCFRLSVGPHKQWRGKALERFGMFLRGSVCSFYGWQSLYTPSQHLLMTRDPSAAQILGIRARRLTELTKNSMPTCTIMSKLLKFFHSPLPHRQAEPSDQQSTQQPSLVNQRVTSNAGGKDQNAERPNNNPLEQHLFLASKDVNIEDGAMFFLDTKDPSERVTERAAFKDASEIYIEGGAFVLGSAASAIRIAEDQHQAVKKRLEIEKRMLVWEEQQLEIRMFQSIPHMCRC